MSGRIGQVSFEKAPSRVVHIRNVPTDTTQEELLSIFTPFGAVEKVVLMKAKKQAMVQMRDLTAAINFISHSTTSQLRLGGRNVYAGFSIHGELSAESTSNKIILVTFYNPMHEQLGETMLNLINVDFVYQLFSQYGQIHKIVIMNKEAVGVQALVQYFMVEGAKQAKTMFTSYTFYAGESLGQFTIDVQFSHLTDLTVKVNNNRTRDFLDQTLQPYYGADYQLMQTAMVQSGAIDPQMALCAGMMPYAYDPAQYQQMLLQQQYLMAPEQFPQTEPAIQAQSLENTVHVSNTQPPPPATPSSTSPPPPPPKSTETQPPVVNKSSSSHTISPQNAEKEPAPCEPSAPTEKVSTNKTSSTITDDNTTNTTNTSNNTGSTTTDIAKPNENNPPKSTEEEPTTEETPTHTPNIKGTEATKQELPSNKGTEHPPQNTPIQEQQATPPDPKKRRT
ncbi:polypyrimidine tract-binding protein 3 [Pelomyxa schiedti]|nr:polypyrimidine tract-binding protein 3 [Pelomyxa schiedti]